MNPHGRELRAANERRRGLTLIELIVATGLASLLVVALVTLVQTTLGLWGRTEARRDLSEHALAISELVADDLVSLDGGPRGDLLADWAAFDTDGDGIAGLVLPRLRLVRRLSAAELSRRSARVPGASEPSAPTLAEVVWVLLPGEVGSLRRGERLLGEDESASFVEDGFFDARGLPPEGATDEVSEAVLWFRPLFASQASDLEAGWVLGGDVLDCATAWDAWTSGRTDEDLLAANAPPAGCPSARGLPVFPRRVRIELEIERTKDLDRRTTLAEPVGPEDTQLVLRDERFAPPAGAYVRLDEEWMEVRRVAGGRVTVDRGVRGSRNTDHARGARVHFGYRSVRELRVPAHREDWNL